ncbi:toluene tolerance protein [Accumulibacter sp.]|uniref:toluene tolerance protein n=1 Tax=Accumulibacter sp. TaxID=2053492 RepID=UPI0025F99E55|nr:toluene tolerance protein [Accumulibacter sp.]MCM8614239.1 toluene tolerance protein [Accumulibacter sp.]MCM8637992.1 toluene tolerance protein [Accumulibacter sp.]MCM8641364.1 toluene tolerance protein [Accumulibacter sp.]
MKRITAEEYQRLRAGAEVLEADSFGDKVLRLADGTILKLFRRKRLLSSAAWYPYARRFADNAVAIRRRGIAVPEIIDIMRIPSLARDAVHYQPLPGVSLRQLLRAGMDVDTRQKLRTAFTRFVIELHDKGVYFRSLHLGNVLHLPDGSFGLIDIADARLRPWRLSRHLRRRNLRLLLAAAGESELVDTAAVLAGCRTEAS